MQPMNKNSKIDSNEDWNLRRSLPLERVTSKPENLHQCNMFAWGSTQDRSSPCRHSLSLTGPYQSVSHVFRDISIRNLNDTERVQSPPCEIGSQYSQAGSSRTKTNVKPPVRSRETRIRNPMERPLTCSAIQGKVLNALTVITHRNNTDYLKD